MPSRTLLPTLLPRHRFMVVRVVFWLVMIGLLVWNAPGWVQQVQEFHGGPPLILVIADIITATILLGGIGLGAAFEIQLARLPGDRASRSLYRAIESIAAQHADGDELIDYASDGTKQAHLTCDRTTSYLGFFRVSARDVDLPLGADEPGYTAADRIRLLPKVGTVQIRRTGAVSYRAEDGSLQHRITPGRSEGLRTMLLQSRTGVGIATHKELAELLAQLQRSSPVEA